MGDGQLKREDFDNQEDWYRYCHEGGIEPFDPAEPFQGIQASGHYGALAGAIYGHTRREHQRTYEGWGETKGLSGKKIEKAYRAVAFANSRGRLMNTAMSITWSTVGIHGDHQVLGSQKRFLERLRKWFEHRGIWPAWIWALERGGKRGLHSHLLISVPGELAKDFRVGVRAILEGVVKRPLVETKNEKTVDFAVRQGVQIVAQWEDFRYIMKGLEPGSYGWRAEDDLDELHLEDRARIRTRPQGIVTLKRLGMSRELDSASYGRWAAVNDFPAATITDDPTQQLYDDRFWQWFVVNENQLIEPPRNKKRKLSKEETEADG